MDRPEPGLSFLQLLRGDRQLHHHRLACEPGLLEPRHRRTRIVERLGSDGKPGASRPGLRSVHSGRHDHASTKFRWPGQCHRPKLPVGCFAPAPDDSPRFRESSTVGSTGLAPRGPGIEAPRPTARGGGDPPDRAVPTARSRRNLPGGKRRHADAGRGVTRPAAGPSRLTAVRYLGQWVHGWHPCPPADLTSIRPREGESIVVAVAPFGHVPPVAGHRVVRHLLCPVLCRRPWGRCRPGVREEFRHCLVAVPQTDRVSVWVTAGAD